MHTAPKTTSAATLLLLLSLYTTQYLAPSFLLEALVAILRERGAPLHQLSLIYLLGLVWVFKFLWAPPIDRFTLHGSSHAKGWLLLFQSLLALTLLLLGRCDIGGGQAKLLLLCLLLSFFSASQEMTIDGLSCRLLPFAQRGTGNGIKTAGGLLGFMLGGGVMLMAYPYLGWPSSLLLLALASLLPLVPLLFFREPVLFTAQASAPAGYLSLLREFWAGKGFWWPLLIMYPTGLCMAYALILPLLVDSGWPLARIGLVVNICGTLVGAFSAMVSGWLIQRLGRRRILLGMAGLQGLAALLLLLPASGRNDIFSVGLAVGALLLLYGPAVTVMTTLMMDMTSPHAPATQFAMQHSLFMLTGKIFSALGVAGAGLLGYPSIIVAASALSFIALGLAARSYPLIAAQTAALAAIDTPLIDQPQPGYRP